MNDTIERPADAIDIGFVGLGNMGRTHARRLARLGHDVVAGADVDREARAGFVIDFGADPYEDPERLLEADPDAVVITTPPRYHEPAATPALERGLDVLLEKPLAHDLSSAERIVDAGRRSRGSCMVGFHNRFRNAVRMVASYRSEGRFGRLTHVEANYVRRRGTPADSWMTNGELAGRSPISARTPSISHCTSWAIPTSSRLRERPDRSSPGPAPAT